MLRIEIIKDIFCKGNAKRPLVFWKIEYYIELDASLYLSNGANCKFFKMITIDSNGFLKQYVDDFEMRNHKLFILDCFALKFEFVDIKKLRIGTLQANHTVYVIFLDEYPLRNLFEHH